MVSRDHSVPAIETRERAHRLQQSLATKMILTESQVQSIDRGILKLSMGNIGVTMTTERIVTSSIVTILDYIR